MRRLLVLALLVLGTSPGLAQADFLLAARTPPPANNIRSDTQRPRISNQQAASKIKRSVPGSKILSIKLIKSKGPPVYRVKTLSGDGVVKFVFVDGINGEIFK